MTNTSIPEIQLFETRAEMGAQAAAIVAAKILSLLETRQEINMVFAAAPSQNEFLNALNQYELPWQQINAFHMDEYVGLDASAPQGFGNFLRDRIFGLHQFKSVNYLGGDGSDPSAAIETYVNLLKKHPIDIVCLGIGENGHLAFNDPPVADFEDREWVKLVELDEACRNQQVNDGCFEHIDQVPTRALTLTIPALLSAPHLFCIVPGPRKAKAVHDTLNRPLSHAYPSTALRTHGGVVLFLDRESASLL